MKRGFLFSLFVLAILFVFVLPNVYAATGLAGDVQTGADKAEQTAQQIQDVANSVKNNPWEYLGSQWQSFLLQIPIVQKVDSFFHSITWVFRILFGYHYSLSIVLFLSILFWIIFYRFSSIILVTFSAFSKWISYLIALGMTIIIAQVGLFYLLAEWCLKIMFYREGVWSWVSVPIFILIILFIFAFTRLLVSGLGKFVKGKKDKEKEEETDKSRKVIDSVAKGVKEGSK